MSATLRAAIAAALACVLSFAIALPAFALGLGQIQVRSGPGQPLLAEIPIVTSDPSELDGLQARLASPDTFRRIGLQAPQGTVSNLQFEVALDARGNPVIRVTSPGPVQEPLLTFLVEVDWGQGRLVREYSALLEAPRSVAAPTQPQIQAPSAPLPSTVVRSADPPRPTATVVPDPEPDRGPVEPAPRPQTEIVVAPPPRALAPAAPSSEAAGGYGPVKAGDTLGEIARGLQSGGATLDQTMVALLRANPEAFIDDNINLLRRGVVLRAPSSDALSRYTASEARALVREQVSQWRELRRPAPQPEAATGTAVAATSAAVAGAGAQARPRVTDARLEIVPPSKGSGQRAGTRSGMASGGEGEMLRQEMQQTNETLAARTAEVSELKARVAELEQLQQQQQQLISLKDSELAAAQQRLAASNEQAPPTIASTSVAGRDAATPAQAGGMPWLWIGLGLLAAATVAWWLLRRRRPMPPTRAFDTAALAAGMPRPSQDGTDAFTGRGVDMDGDVDLVDGDAFAGESFATEAFARGDFTSEASTSEAASDDERFVGDSAVEPDGEAEGHGLVAPPWHPGGVGPAAGQDASTSVSLNAAPAGHERIELARAYVDLGDVDTARSLLQEVVAGGDAEARDEAGRLLRDLS